MKGEKMKKILFVVMSMLIVSCAFAQGVVKLDETNLKKFMGVYPEYKKLVMSYGENADVNESMALAMKYKNEIESLCKAHGLTFEEFPQIAAKVGYALAAVNMKEQGLSPQAFGMKDYVSEEEISLVERNKTRLQEIMMEGEESGE